MHLNKLTHRDIKLGNIVYFSHSNSFKLIDFGTALSYENESPNKIIYTDGTPGYYPNYLDKSPDYNDEGYR